MKIVMGCAVVAAALSTAARAEAQVFSPTYMAPRVSNEVGLYVSDGPGDLAAEGSIRRNFTGTMLGLRAGLADTEDLSFTLGGELLHPLPVTSAPIDLALTGAAQILVGGPKAAGFSVGVDVGHTFLAPGIAVTPYVHPRLGVTGYYGDEGDFDADLLADLGVNLDLAPNLSLRLGIGLTGPEANWGFGLAWRQ
jgi:hypothetical protein